VAEVIAADRADFVSAITAQLVHVEVVRRLVELIDDGHL